MKIFAWTKKFSKKLHSFDIAFVALAIGILAIFYFAFRRQTVFITIRAKMEIKNELAIGYVVGDKEVDELGRTVAQIESVESYIISPNLVGVYLDIRLKTVFNPRTGVYSSKGKDILFGETITVAFTKSRFKGVIVDLPGLSETLHITNKKTTVKARTNYDSRQFSDIYGIPDYLADSLKAGDTVTDTRGNVLAKILDVTITPAKRTVVTSNGQPFVVDDPELKDVSYTIELESKEVYGNLYMFDFKPLLIGESIPFYARHTSLWPTITEIIK